MPLSTASRIQEKRSSLRAEGEAIHEKNIVIYKKLFNFQKNVKKMKKIQKKCIFFEKIIILLLTFFYFENILFLTVATQDCDSNCFLT